MDKKFTVYKHTNKENGKVYIGITGSNPEARWGRGKGYRANTHFKFAISKYGWDSFSHEILYSGLSKEEAQALEIKLIAEYEATNPDKGYNSSLGGEGRFGTVCSEEEKEAKRKITLALWRDPEFRNKTIQGMTGTRRTEETRRKISEATKGRIISTEQRKAISETLKVYYSDEKNRKRQSDLKAKRPVICIETQVVYESSHDAGRKTGVCQGNIYACCAGKRPHAGGFSWSFYYPQADTEVSLGLTA